MAKTIQAEGRNVTFQELDEMKVSSISTLPRHVKALSQESGTTPAISQENSRSFPPAPETKPSHTVGAIKKTNRKSAVDK